MGEYHPLYLKTDVLLLADVFENFRKMCLEIYQLNLAKFLSAPRFAWQAGLKKTEVKLELLTDIDMLLIVEKGTRCGIDMQNLIINIWKIAIKNKELSYLKYWDVNNLYG